ncbi:MAG TPA: ATP synthase subunit I [Candidatus Acidoferrum sp.]|nr:ATP synthase subunit I [Candidatus Acidoferrum sp.]
MRRIAYLIPVFGAAGGLLAALTHKFDWAEGLIAGSALAWLNFRWLKRGLEVFTSSAGGQVGPERPPGRGATFLAAIFRYALIGFAVYVIFNYLHVPLVSIVLGLCAFAAATITASVWEIVQAID